jgi:hypothetical protein
MRILNLFLALAVCNAFYQKQAISRHLSQSRPLSTANNGALGHIPRLEIGLRYIFKVEEALSNDIPHETMNWFAEPEILNEPRGFMRTLQDAFDVVKRTVTNFFGYIRKVMAATMIIASSLTSFGIKKTAAVTSVLSSIAMPKASHAGVLKKYSKLSPTQKLATTPLFFICNAGGNPYLQDDVQAGKPDQKIIIYFMSSEDASEFLSEIAQSQPSSVNEFRIMTTSMEKVCSIMRHSYAFS